jgi:WD40 repeat protein
MARPGDNCGLWDPWIDGGESALPDPPPRFQQKTAAAVLLTLLSVMILGSLGVLFLHETRVPIPVAPAPPVPLPIATTPGLLVPVEPIIPRPPVFLPSPIATAPAQVPKRTVRVPQGIVWCLAFSPDGRTLASGAGPWDRPNIITLWDVSTWNREPGLPEPRGNRSGGTLHDVPALKERFLLAGHSQTITGLAFSPDGKMLASAGNDGVVKLWDVGRGEERALFPGPRDTNACAAFSPDGKTLALGEGDPRTEGPFAIRLWDLAEGRERGRINGLKRAPVSLAFSPDGKTIASAGNLVMAELWDAGSGAHQATLHGHYLPVSHVAFSTDGKVLATEGNDEHVRLWDVATAGPRADWPYAAKPTFSLVGNLVAVTQSTTEGFMIQLRDVATGKVRAMFPGAARTLAFSPDGLLLATSPTNDDRGGEIHLWSVRRGLEVEAEQSASAPK